MGFKVNTYVVLGGPILPSKMYTKNEIFSSPCSAKLSIGYTLLRAGVRQTLYWSQPVHMIVNYTAPKRLDSKPYISDKIQKEIGYFVIHKQFVQQKYMYRVFKLEV